MQRVRDSLHEQQGSLRRRPPRAFLTDKKLAQYSYANSVGLYVLSTVEKGRYMSEGIKGHAQLSDYVVVITGQRVLAAVVERKNALWQVLLKTITLVKLHKDGSELVIYSLGRDLGAPSLIQEHQEVAGDQEILSFLAALLEEFK
jgi:hypothetical protein